MRISGNDDAAKSTFAAVVQLSNVAEAVTLPRKPAGFFFPTVRSVATQYGRIRDAAADELIKQGTDAEMPHGLILSVFDLAVAAGKPLNQVIPSSKTILNAEALELHRSALDGILKSLSTVGSEAASFVEKLTLGSGAALRNAIRSNALVPLSDALVSDLSAILAGYRRTDFFKPTSGKLPGVDRLLLILDDFENLKGVLGEFLISHFLPRLQLADFESTVIIMGRDQLELTHSGWDQHFQGAMVKRITLDPLLRSEMDELVTAHGVRTQTEMDRAWADTQGYPFYVQLWLEESERGGRSAVMLKRFYDRTTRWMDSRQRQWLDFTILMGEVNLRTLRQALGDEEQAQEAFHWFQNEGSVRDTKGEHFRVREYLRSRLADYLRLSDPDKFEKIQKQCSTLSTAKQLIA